MRARSLVGALVLAALTAAPSLGQPAVPGGPAPSTGRDLEPEAQQIIDAGGAAGYFEAVSDTRFRAVRHVPSGFMCSFMPLSEASVQVLDVEDVPAGDDVQCTEVQGNAVMDFRISRFDDESVDSLSDFMRAHLSRELEGDVREIPGAPAMDRSPAPPFVELGAPSRRALFVGEAEGGPAMYRFAIAELPGDWFVTQRYHVLLPPADDAQLDSWAVYGSALAESVLAARLGELEVPAIDPALTPP